MQGSGIACTISVSNVNIPKWMLHSRPFHIAVCMDDTRNEGVENSKGIEEGHVRQTDDRCERDREISIKGQFWSSDPCFIHRYLVLTLLT